MSNYRAKHMIEALRSGVPSRAVGEAFSDARPGILQKITERMNKVRETGASDGFLYTGRYGEGKTHLLNTVFGMAGAANMVVSYVPLGKETPPEKTYLLYKKVMEGTYLPGAEQPGFLAQMEKLTPNSTATTEMLSYAFGELETDKLYYLLQAYVGTQDEEERYAFLCDLEGDFVNNALIKKSYRRVTGKVAKINQNFSKRKHAMDYFRFMSHFFKQLGYDGWVILFDEVELMGRFGKKSRAKGYAQLRKFLKPGEELEGVFSLFALSASYSDDVIEKRKEFQNVEAAFAEDDAARQDALTVLDAMIKAPELLPLTKEEILHVLEQIRAYHGEAYDWTPQLTAEALYEATEAGGYLLRTKIRAAIEMLDQLYQYGEAGEAVVTEMGEESLEEDVTLAAEDAGEE